MTTITIDNEDYVLEDLSEEARAQLASLQVTDAEIQRLQMLMAITQTARMAYANALKQALPPAQPLKDSAKDSKDSKAGDKAKS